MASQIQLVIYEGYLVDEPTMRYTPAGTAVTNFRMGSNRKFKTSAGEVRKEVTWLKVASWGKLAEIVNEWCSKGSHVIVTGKLRVGEDGSPVPYQMKNGEWGASYEITADEVRILDSKGSDATSPETNQPPMDDEIPF